MDTAALRTAQPHTVHVEVKAEHLQALARAKPVNALAELIWNAVDADADNVWIEIDDNDLGTPEVIRVIDDGDGIAFDRVQAAFGNLGESWKKKRHQTLRSAKRLHGRDGKGRLKAFSLGNHVSWRTTYLGEQDKRFTYEIKGALHDICDFPYADHVEVVGPGDRGTTVTITGIEEKLSVFAEDGSAEQQLSELFAIYLRDYPATKIFFRGQRLNIAAVQHATKTMPLTSFFVDGAEVSGSVEVIEWKFAKSERKLCLCDDVGYRLHEIDALIRPGAEFNFTAYLKSDYISRLHDQGVLDLAELDTGLTKLVEDARNQLRSYFRQRKSATAASLVDEWKREGIYPFKEETADPVERARREVFDIAAVNVNEYLDAFRLGGLKERKLTLKLIATAVDAQIIDGLGHNAPYTRRGTDLEILALRLLHRKPPKLMIVDEVHHLLAGTVREQRQSLNQLKFLSNELRMPVVALGTSEALYAMQADPQIASRFEPFALPRWHESAALREFVVSFGRLLPLHKPSPFGDKAIIQKLMVHSGGLTGKITSLLAQAAELAIRRKTESISLDLLIDAAAAGVFKIPAEQEIDDALA